MVTSAGGERRHGEVFGGSFTVSVEPTVTTVVERGAPDDPPGPYTSPTTMPTANTATQPAMARACLRIGFTDGTYPRGRPETCPW